MDELNPTVREQEIYEEMELTPEMIKSIRTLCATCLRHFVEAKEGLDMTNMNVIPVSQDSYIVNGCKVKITYAEDGDSMEVLQKLIHDTLCEEAKNYS